MRDAGVDIEGHTVSHSLLNARKGKTDEQYLAWLKSEIVGSKEMLEKNLGIQVKAFAYPYGLHNQTVRDVVKQAGYEAAFTVWGRRIGYGADPMIVGRYAIESTKPKVFEEAVNFKGAVEGDSAGVLPAAGTMVTQPKDGETVSDSLPEIKANLTTLGDVDPKSVTMRISGLGLVPATYDSESKLVSYKLTQKLYGPQVTVIVSAVVKARKTETCLCQSVLKGSEPLGGCAAVSPHQQGTVFAHVRSIEGVPRAGPARPDTWNALAQALSLQTLHGPSEAQIVGASNRALPSADGGIPGVISTRAGE